MNQRLKTVLFFALLASAALATAQDRLAVFEFFGRTGCANCQAGGAVITTLQSRLQGRAVLLEYDYDTFLYGRQDRFWASGASAYYLPLVMVGSGYRTSSGVVDFDRVYPGMIDAELARPPRAVLTAFWRRAGNAMRAYVEIENPGPADLQVDREATLWVIAYENAAIGLTGTWVRTTALWRLPFDLAQGERVTGVVDTPPMSGVNWDRMAGLVLIEDRLGSSGAYDLLQAADAPPAGLIVEPDRLVVSALGGDAEVAVRGPHVLTWSAASNVAWLEVTPQEGTLPAGVTVTLRPELRPLNAADGLVTVTASGDGMAFEEKVSVAVGAQQRRAGRRVSPSR